MAEGEVFNPAEIREGAENEFNKLEFGDEITPRNAVEYFSGVAESAKSFLKKNPDFLTAETSKDFSEKLFNLTLNEMKRGGMELTNEQELALKSLIDDFMREVNTSQKPQVSLRSKVEDPASYMEEIAKLESKLTGKMDTDRPIWNEMLEMHVAETILRLERAGKSAVLNGTMTIGTTKVELKTQGDLLTATINGVAFNFSYESIKKKLK